MRPRPPAHLLDALLDGNSFVAAPDLIEWATATFITPGGPLHNSDHAHLEFATLGALWTNVPNARHGRAIVGQAELGKTIGGMGKWTKARAEQQVREWFGEIPTFVLTFDAGYAEQASDAEFCALVDHELYHAAPECDEFGQPKFSKTTGLPTFCMRGHDIEEFIGVVRRYGAISPAIAAMVEAAKGAPLIDVGSIRGACGNCVGT